MGKFRGKILHNVVQNESQDGGVDTARLFLQSHQEPASVHLFP